MNGWRSPPQWRSMTIDMGNTFTVFVENALGKSEAAIK